ncbi:hypothetical protein SLE2022_279860 [Rubroshorea leprosula]
MARRYCYSEVLPFAAMVGAECSTVGLNILFKAATLRGMSYNIFNAYSFAISTLVLIPFLFIFPSSAVLPSFRFPLISRICLLAFIGSFGQILGYKGIEYSSPTLASSISNLTPAFTFILAIIFRMEKVAFRSSSTQAKMIGTIVSISGAFVAVLYKGPTVFSSAPPVLLQWHLGSSSLSNWLIGGLLLVAQYLLFSIWYIVQTQVMKMYPAEFTVVFLYNLFATVMCMPVCLIAEPNLSSWILSPSIAIAAVIYSGFVGAVINVVHTWGLHLKGPVYIAIFKPLSIVIAAAMSALFLGDALYLGSVIGAVIISVGFYAVIWGKAKEEAMEEDSLVRSLLIPSSNDQFPLSQNTKL